MDLNKVMLIGRLTKQPEPKKTKSGKTVVNFTVATNEKYGDDERVEFNNIVAFGKLADIIVEYCGKGKKVYIEGRLRTNKWEGKDGTPRSRTEIIANNLIMLDSLKKSHTESIKPEIEDYKNEVNIDDIPF